MTAPEPPTLAKLGKPQRQHLITKLIEHRGVQNQAQLVELLAEEGCTATQATVSRDLDDLGAIKVRVPGGESAYAIPALPAQQVAPEDHLSSRWRTPPTWSCSGRRRAVPMSWAPLSTGPACPRSSVRSPATTRLSWSSPSRPAVAPWPTA
jgi:hypothetical protein